MELNDGKVKIISYYLPQYYPFKENDEWWGKGFTEWTNVGKAKPFFRGHYQPKVPADLGYYDLRVPEIAEAQAELAREAGITGFCYWHYWHGNGKTLMEMPIKRLLRTGKPDFPFCFSWANHSWYDKSAYYNSKGAYKLLMKQSYPGEEDNEKHFYHCLDAFKDKRYMRYNECPIFTIYDPFDIPKVNEFIDQWNYLIKKEGIADKFLFVANLSKEKEYETIKKMGFDNIISNVLAFPKIVKLKKIFYYANARLWHFLGNNNKVWQIYDYKKIINNYWKDEFLGKEDVIPTIFPNWDHTPRSGRYGSMYINSTPENFQLLAHNVITEVRKKNNKIILLKSWNEWGEGNYMEPDLRYGHGYIDALRNAIKEC